MKATLVVIGIDGLAGVIAICLSVAAVTVTVALPLTTPIVAVMFALPALSGGDQSDAARGVGHESDAGGVGRPGHAVGQIDRGHVRVVPGCHQVHRARDGEGRGRRRDRDALQHRRGHGDRGVAADRTQAGGDDARPSGDRGGHLRPR